MTMKSYMRVLTVAMLAVGGLTVFVLVSRGTNEHGIMTYGPDDGSGRPVTEKSPAIIVSSAATPVAENTGQPVVVPVGTVVAWLKSYSNTPSLSREWVECNGQTLNLSGSPYDGMVVPNLNGADNQTKRFLRGSTEGGAAGGAEYHSHGLYLIGRGAKREVNVSSKASASNLPPYYEVTWIMRVL